MAGFNPNSPALLGSEHHPSFDPTVKLDSALAGLAMRFRSPGTPTIANLHPYLAEVAGNPGLALEIVDELVPDDVTSTDFFPGTDTGQTVTGWEDQSNSTAEFGEVDDRYDTADYHRNAASLSRQSTLANLHRGNDSGALAGRRILRVEIGVHFHLRSHVNGNDPSVPIRARLTIDGTAYRRAPYRPQSSVNAETKLELGLWARNPSTGLPWTVAEVDDLIDAADGDTFGVEVGGRLGAEGFRLHGYWLTVWHCDENRLGYFYATGAPRAGWTERALSATAALAADTSYYYVIYPLTGGPGDYLRIPRPRDPNAVIDDDPAGSDEHRTAYQVRLFSRGGAAVESTEVAGGLLPVLFDSGSIETPSQPYAEVDQISINRDETAGANPGQQITASVGTTYAAVLATVAWANPAGHPDRPLIIEIREASATGTLAATATLRPEDTRASADQYLVPLDASFAAGSIQYHLVVKSQTSPGRSWRIFRADTRTDDIGSGTTAAELQGATQGGTTDSWFDSGSANDRYDWPVTLVAAPTGPASFAATVRQAA